MQYLVMRTKSGIVECLGGVEEEDPRTVANLCGDDLTGYQENREKHIRHLLAEANWPWADGDQLTLQDTRPEENARL